MLLHQKAVYEKALIHFFWLVIYTMTQSDRRLCVNTTVSINREQSSTQHKQQCNIILLYCTTIILHLSVFLSDTQRNAMVLLLLSLFAC
jgi:hypothetical protein